MDKDIEQDILAKCLKHEPSGYKALYDIYCRKMYGVCMRYVRINSEAEDLLQDGFVKVFENLGNFKGTGSLENWIRSIMINNAVNHYKKNIERLYDIDIETMDNIKNLSEDDIGNLDFIESEIDLYDIPNEVIVELIQELPESKKIIFNLYVIEGYSHKEIGEILNITESTSKSQLSKAKILLKKKIKKIDKYNEIKV